MQNTNIKKTVNEKELETLKFWNENNIFEKSVTNPAGKNLNITNETEKEEIQSFSFYDGPPFATGLPHNGHILAGTIKDAIPRYQTMQGKSVRRVWGWDCHGLPIENLIEKELNLNSKKDIEELGVDVFNKAAADSVLRFENEWRQRVPRLGRWVDMDNSYKTMDWTYTESVWWVWKSLFDKGLAYEGHKIMHICPRCETPLAQSEVGLEYTDITDLSVTAKFELEEKDMDGNPVYVLAWTTTPWTLPGNTALAINSNIEYVIVNNVEGEEAKSFIVAKKRVEEVFKGKVYSIKSDVDTRSLIGKKYKPVFETFNNEKFLSELENSQNIYKIWHADFITDDSGTGIAHEAPAFGAEDMELAKQNDIPVIKHVLMNGHFVQEVEEGVPELAGLVVKKVNDSMSTDIEIIKWLAHNGKLFSKEKINHSYPLCWRCKTPLLNYATSSWFVDVPSIKEKLINENQKVKWVPEHIRDGRFGRWLEGAREWAVSRRRYWGAPLPIWRSIDGIETKVIGSLEEMAQKPKNNYFVMRHGEALSNTLGILDISGDENNHLTELGVSQVKKSKADNSVHFDIVMSSPFLRTRETASIMASGAEVVIDDRLRESDLGVWDKRSVSEFREWFRGMGPDYINLKTEGGETHGQMRSRVAQLLLELEDKYENKNILLVSHAGPINMMMPWASNMSDKATSDILFTKDASAYAATADIKKLNWQKVCYDETGIINLHKPYIDNVILKDSRGIDMRIIGDVFDCWFESGSMPYAQLHYPFENKDVFEKNFPADFIAEGMDQTRGWFYSLLNLGVGIFDKSPFKNVIVNGTVMAGDGRKMSKSEKNYTDPMLLVEKYGADALRFSLADSPVMQGENVLFSDTLVEESYKKVVSKIENVLDFYNMYKEEKQEQKSKDLQVSTNVLDNWIITRLQQVINTSVEGYDSYRLDKAVSEITAFVDDLSTWYLRRSRDRLKASDNVDDYDSESECAESVQDKKYALATLEYTFINFSKVVAPIMPFLAERVYQDVANEEDKMITESVHLTKYPSKIEISAEQKEILAAMKMCRDVCSEALMLRQKINIPVRQPLLKLTINKNIVQKDYLEIIKEEINIKEVKVNLDLTACELDTNITPELKREGDQRELSRAIKDLRKELSLLASDYITLTITADKTEFLDDNYKKAMKIKAVKIGESLRVDKLL